MQMGGRDISHRYSGPRQCLQHLLKTEGTRGLARGLGATVAREAPGNAIFFTVYEVRLYQLLVPLKHVRSVDIDRSHSWTECYGCGPRFAHRAEYAAVANTECASVASRLF